MNTTTDATEPTYRVPASQHPVGTAMGNGLHVIQSPEEHLIGQLRVAIERYFRSQEPDRKSVTRYERGIRYGRMYALAEALAAIQAGSSWFTGDAPRRLIEAHFDAMQTTPPRASEEVSDAPDIVEADFEG